jgi:hypothetical protein
VSASVAELTLILKAQNLATTAFNDMKSGLDSVATKAKTTAQKVADSFKSGAMRHLFDAIGPSFFRVINALVTGRNIPQAFTEMGLIAAASMAAEFGDKIIDKIAASGFVVKLSAFMSAAGKVVGGVIDKAIALGMAALPFVLAGVLIAALVYLVTHPEVVRKLHDIAMTIIGKIGDGLRGLATFLGGIFGSAMGHVFNVVTYWVGKIVRKLQQIIQHIAAAAKAAIHLGQIRLPNLSEFNLPGHAAGGWVGMNGPELAWVGEKGPEYIVPNGGGTGSGGGTGVMIQGVTEREIVDMVDRGLFFRLQRASPTLSRT